MQISVMNNESEHIATENLSVKPQVVYDLVLDVIQPRWRENQIALQLLSFKYDEHDPVSGGFFFSVDRVPYASIEVNLARIRTYRDLIFTTLHEWRHALQYQENRREFIRKSNRIMRSKNYDVYQESDLELDADAFAFTQESKMTYKNFLVNVRKPESVFIWRKSLRHMGS
jgi:hypothetical protein